MYSIGYAVETFHVSDKTIKNWIERYEDFFDAAAKGRKGVHRRLTEHDLILLNTIDYWRNRAEERKDWEDIRALMTGEDYILEFPQMSLLLDQKEPVQQYTRLIELTTLVTQKDAYITTLEQRLNRLESDPQVDHWIGQVRQLEREVGKLEAKTELQADELNRLRQRLAEIEKGVKD